MKHSISILVLICSFGALHAVDEDAGIGTELRYCQDKQKNYSSPEECQKECGGACIYNPLSFDY